MTRINRLVLKHGVSALVYLATAATTVVAATPAFEIEHLVFYQSGDVVEERLPDFNTLSDYVKRLKEVCQRFFANSSSRESLDIVVAVRPGRQSRVWFVSSTQSNPDQKRESLRRELQKVKPCEVVKGPIAFAISGNVAGGDGKRPKGNTPMPVEWRKATERQGNAEVPDGILDIVWPRK